MSIVDDYTPGGYPNRTLCDVLKEMRTCYKTYNFAPVISLIEEAQIMGNKMEAALETSKDLRNMQDQLKRGRKELKELKKKLKKENK